MSEEKLEQALEEMRNENPSPEQLAGAHTRVWQKLAHPIPAACLEFRQEIPEYLAGQLALKRRLLMDDHISRCAQCRTELATIKGERNVIPLPHRRASRWPRWGTWAAAAVFVIMALYVGRDRIDTLMAPGGPRATVASLTGGLYRIPDAALQAGSSIGEGEVFRTGPGARAVLSLADGSRIEVNERSELYVSAAWSGQTVHLKRGDIIVQAAKQRRGHLRVMTRDSVAAVKGTVFAVSAGISGTLVSVVEGSVAVTQPGTEVLLSPGEQAASHPGLAESVQDAIAWSPDAESYLAQLAAFANVEKQLAALPAPALRTQPRLLAQLPPNSLVYGAVPNLGTTIEQALSLFEQQAAGNPVLQQWWSSGDALKLKEMVGRIQTVTPLLGNEIIFAYAAAEPGARQDIPMLAAEVQSGKRAELAGAIEALRGQAGDIPIPYSVSDSLLVVSDSQEHLQWLLSHLGQGASAPFASAIAARYQKGAGWLLALDMVQISSAAAQAPQAAILGVQQMKYLIFERRSVQGIDENEITLTFNGPRMGMASWLADSGSGGAAEYISSDAVFAAYGSNRDPRQLFEELMGQLARFNPGIQNDLAAAESQIGARFVEDLIAAWGTESAFGLEGLSLAGPVWELAVLVNNPLVIDNSVRTLVEKFNAEEGASDPAKRLILSQETVDGRSWMQLKSGVSPLSVIWTYDNGYLVAASDRAAALRAIANRNGGAQLVWSPAFQQQLPSTAGLHPSGFAWLNTKGALQGLTSLVSNPALQQLINERDPILVVFNGTSEQIHVASRTRITGLIMDLMLLQNLGRTRSGPAPVVQ